MGLEGIVIWEEARREFDILTRNVTGYSLGRK